MNHLHTQHWYVHRFFRDQLEKIQKTSAVRQVKSLYYIFKYLEGSPTKTFPIVLEISPTNTFPMVLETSPTNPFASFGRWGCGGPIRLGRGKSISKVIGRQPALQHDPQYCSAFFFGAIIELFF